jgi:hypothetical protein
MIFVLGRWAQSVSMSFFFSAFVSYFTSPYSELARSMARSQAPLFDPQMELDQRIARGEIVAVPGQEANANSVSARHQPEAIVLDLMYPTRAGRRVKGQ